LTRDAIRRQFETNVFGAMELTGILVPRMRSNGCGKIVFISSVNGRVTFPFMGAYCASKHAIESVADALRRELKNEPISVTVIQPGLFRTNAIKNARRIFDSGNVALSGIHQQRYESLFGYLNASVEKIDKNASSAVAHAVYRTLNARMPVARLIVPPESRVYELMYRMFPDCLQDFLISRKMGFLFGPGRRHSQK
jgi:NAD(P)-dependent dehydrogenase (short-subunit alcohol dehydrogenase family)